MKLSFKKKANKENISFSNDSYSMVIFESDTLDPKGMIEALETLGFPSDWFDREEAEEVYEEMGGLNINVSLLPPDNLSEWDSWIRDLETLKRLLNELPPLFRANLSIKCGLSLLKITLKAYLKKANLGVLDFFRKDPRYQVETFHNEDTLITCICNQVLDPENQEYRTSRAYLNFSTGGQLEYDTRDGFGFEGFLISQLEEDVKDLTVKINSGQLNLLPELAEKFCELDRLSKEEKDPWTPIASKLTLKATILRTASRWEQISDFFKQDSRFEVSDLNEPGEVVDVEDAEGELVVPKAAQGRLVFGLYIFKGESAGLILEQPVDPRGVLKTQLSISIHGLIDEVSEGNLEKLPELADLLVGYAELPTEKYQYDKASS